MSFILPRVVDGRTMKASSVFALALVLMVACSSEATSSEAPEASTPDASPEAACFTCAELGNVPCGYHDDGCDGYISCGTCANPQSTCVEGDCECTPLGCVDFNFTCGAHYDGCLYYFTCDPCH